jgi:hypothetical protein
MHMTPDSIPYMFVSTQQKDVTTSNMSFKPRIRNRNVLDVIHRGHNAIIIIIIIIIIILQHKPREEEHTAVHTGSSPWPICFSANYKPFSQQI